MADLRQEADPMDDHDTHLATVLRERGQRVTPQRITIARALRRLDRHATAEDVTAAVARDLPGVSVPTVYATLELLSELGLARRVTASSRAVMYDPRPDDHHHALCVRCGRVEDIEAPLDPAAAMRSARGQGFEPERVDLVVSGLCADCRGGRLVPATARPTLGGE
jgi:Fe2+ or Zn2+ uptake regulation protein